MKRNIWIPKMTISKLSSLLKKIKLTCDDKEDLLDFLYFITHQKKDALEKGLMKLISVNQKTCDIKGYIILPKKMWWIENIKHLTKGFNSKYYLPVTT